MSVKIGCRVLNGLTVNVHYQDLQFQVHLKGPPGHGDWSFDQKGSPTRTGNIDNHSFTGSQPMRGAYGVTTIDDQQWSAIQRFHADADWLKRGMVFKLAG